jgi:hypothetical protein
MEMLKPLEKKNHGCLCCESLELHLPFDTVLYQGFGGWSITKDGQHFFSEDSDKEFDEMKTLAYIEEIASKEPDADWRAICDTPLHGETYQRQNGKWVLVEQNEGFA